MLITDRRTASGDLLDVLAAALEGGARWILVREKDLPEPQFRRLLEAVLILAAPYDALVSSSGRLVTAAQLGLRCVHLPSAEAGIVRGAPVSPAALEQAIVALAKARTVLGPRASIGLSCHSRGELIIAAAAGADYATFSPIFTTASKPGYGPPLGAESLRDAAAATSMPILALGGIGAGNVAACRAAGAAGVAVLGEILRADDPRAATREILAGWGGGPPHGA
jgi:thiamine-phosphate pyrophosphorylase